MSVVLKLPVVPADAVAIAVRMTSVYVLRNHSLSLMLEAEANAEPPYI